jgi:C_GCAxxG_C_C family probable redox protein
MELKASPFKLLSGTDQKRINRRTFFSQSVVCTAGFMLLTSPGIINSVKATQKDKSQQEIFKELEEKVVKYMPMYRSCALTSFGALNDQFDLKADPAVLRALMPFTGGLSMKGETCGAVSGSLLALGYFFGPIDEKTKQQMPSSVMQGAAFMDSFAKEFSSTRCREVVKHQYGRYFDFTKPEEQKLFMEASQKSNKCMEVVKKAVAIAGDIILKNTKT